MEEYILTEAGITVPRTKNTGAVKGGEKITLRVVRDTWQKRDTRRINKQGCQQKTTDVEYRCGDGGKDGVWFFIDMSTDRGRSFVQL